MEKLPLPLLLAMTSQHLPAGGHGREDSLPRLPFDLQPCVLRAGPRERPAGRNELTVCRPHQQRRAEDPRAAWAETAGEKLALAGAGRRLHSFRPACSAASELGAGSADPVRMGKLSHKETSPPQPRGEFVTAAEPPALLAGMADVSDVAGGGNGLKMVPGGRGGRQRDRGADGKSQTVLHCGPERVTNPRGFARHKQMIKSGSERGQTALSAGSRIRVWTLCPQEAGSGFIPAGTGRPDFPPETTACKGGQRGFTVQTPETRLSPMVKGDEPW